MELLPRVGLSAEFERWIPGWGVHVEVLWSAARDVSRRLARLYGNA